MFAQKSIKDELGEDRLKRLINYCLRYIADLDIPIKRYVYLQDSINSSYLFIEEHLLSTEQACLM